MDHRNAITCEHASCLAFTTILVACCLASIGCKSSHERDTAQVTGIVTLDGTPLTGGGVMFQPASGRGAIGEIESDGSYRLRTYGDDDGAAVGMHQVAVIAGSPANEEEAKTFQAQPIPQHYTGPESSGLEFEVKPGVNNVFDIQLTTPDNR